MRKKRDDDDSDDGDDDGVYITNTEYKCECFFWNGHILSLQTNPSDIWHALQIHHFVGD